MNEAMSVSALNQYIKTMMDRDGVLTAAVVRGEISNYKMYPSGHHYFSLKDAEASLRCVMFRREAARLNFRPEQGMTVIAAGRVTVFPRDGQYQLYCSSLLADGMGELHLAFEQRKKALEREGLFDPAHKKPLPRFPARIALITSPAGAAVRDMIRILGARYPLAEILVIPVRVQGVEAAGEISRAIALANRKGLADVIITGRGGGSMEDLWAFNEELVARAIYHSEIPVISAVGHEPDVTIADYVADLRAATPSNAAELAVPDRQALLRELRSMENRMGSLLQGRVREGRRILEHAQRSPWLKEPFPAIAERQQLLDYQRLRLMQGFDQILTRERERFGVLTASLDALSPLKVLGRGYSIAERENGQIIRDAAQVQTGETLRLRLSGGSLRVRVSGKEGS